MKTGDRKIRGKRDLFLPSSVLYISGLKYANTTNLMKNLKNRKKWRHFSVTWRYFFYWRQCFLYPLSPMLNNERKSSGQFQVQMTVEKFSAFLPCLQLPKMLVLMFGHNLIGCIFILQWKIFCSGSRLDDNYKNACPAIWWDKIITG